MQTIVKHSRLIPGFLCEIICNYNPNFCRLHTHCEKVKLGYRHPKNDNCECRKVQYE